MLTWVTCNSDFSVMCIHMHLYGGRKFVMCCCIYIPDYTMTQKYYIELLSELSKRI